MGWFDGSPPAEQSWQHLTVAGLQSSDMHRIRNRFCFNLPRDRSKALLVPPLPVRGSPCPPTQDYTRAQSTPCTAPQAGLPAAVVEELQGLRACGVEVVQVSRPEALPLLLRRAAVVEVLQADDRADEGQPLLLAALAAGESTTAADR